MVVAFTEGPPDFRYLQKHVNFTSDTWITKALFQASGYGRARNLHSTFAKTGGCNIYVLSDMD